MNEINASDRWSARDEERLSALLEGEAARPGLPPEVYQAVEASWQRRVHETRSRRRRSAWAAAAGLLLALTAYLWFDKTHSPPTVATIGATASNAAIDGASAVAGTEVLAGSTVTTGSSGGALLQLDGSATLRLARQAEVEMLEAGRARLVAGAVYFDSGAPTSAGDGPALYLETPLGVISDIGTQFEALVEGSTVEVRVREGRVEIEAKSGLLRVDSGEQLALATSGPPLRSAIPIYGVAWEWAETLGRPFPLEGRSLHDLFAWAARETGRRLVYSSDQLASDAAAITLHGDAVRGLSPLETVDLGLAGSGLTAHVVNGALQVSRATALAGS